MRKAESATALLFYFYCPEGSMTSSPVSSSLKVDLASEQIAFGLVVPSSCITDCLLQSISL
jgi:hypothetical protein